MRTNLNGCFVAFSLGTPLFVTAQFAEDRVLRHVVTESRDYVECPIFFSFFFFLPFPSGWAGACTDLPPTPHQTLRTSCKQEAERLTPRSTDFGIPRVGRSCASSQKLEMRFCSERRAREERKYVDPVFPSCVFWTCVCEFWW